MFQILFVIVSNSINSYTSNSRTNIRTFGGGITWKVATPVPPRSRDGYPSGFCGHC